MYCCIRSVRGREGEKAGMTSCSLSERWGWGMRHKKPNLSNNNNYNLKYLDKSLSVPNTSPIKVTCINSFNYYDNLITSFLQLFSIADRQTEAEM